MSDMLHNLTHLTYTNSKVNDLHAPYYSRVKKYFKEIKNVYALNDVQIPEVNTFVYKNTQPFFEQICTALNNINTEYVLYSQEDYILYDNVNIEEILRILDTLANDKDISFIRLIQSAIENSLFYNEYFFQLNPDHQYFYSTQATIWRKIDLENMFILSKAQNIRDESQNSTFLKKLDKKGLCTTFKGKSIGNHFNSVIYPYIATALIGGKWNYSDYRKELDILFEEFKIDSNIRGLR